ALEMENWGYRVYLPSLYGDPIGEDSAYGYNKTLSSVKLLKKDGRWNPVATDTFGPITDEISELARAVSRAEGGRKIAVFGNSLTGNVPISLLDESSVRLAVIGQPAAPVPRMHEIMMRLPRSEKKRTALSMSDEEWDGVVRAMKRDSRKRIIGFHYVSDPIASIERFDALHERLGQSGLSRRFKAFVLEGENSTWSDEKPWAITDVTAEPTKMLTPHSTYIDAQDLDDRAWYRKQLRSALSKVSW
ncbi:MAG: hypothetical protein AAGC68_14205, partial [Verrucomicrobiota bacterium]